MRFPHLHNRRICVVFALIVGSGLAIAAAGTANFVRGLLEYGVSQGKYFVSANAAAVNGRVLSCCDHTLNILLKEHPSPLSIADLFITNNG